MVSFPFRCLIKLHLRWSIMEGGGHCCERKEIQSFALLHSNCLGNILRCWQLRHWQRSLSAHEEGWQIYDFVNSSNVIIRPVALTSCNNKQWRPPRGKQTNSEETWSTACGHNVTTHACSLQCVHTIWLWFRMHGARVSIYVRVHQSQGFLQGLNSGNLCAFPRTASGRALFYVTGMSYARCLFTRSFFSKHTF